MNEYFDSITQARIKSRRKLLKRQELEIMRAYDKAFKSAFDDLIKTSKLTNSTAVLTAKVSYTNMLYSQLTDISNKYNIAIVEDTMKQNTQFFKEFLKDYQDTPFFKEIEKNVQKNTQKSVEFLVKGRIYKDGKGLSSRLWNSVSRSGNKIDLAIQSCIASGMSSIEMAKILQEFGTGGHRKWDRATIREKLGPGYASKTGGSLDYESLRLARTTGTHLGQMAVINSAEVNPYIKKVKWNKGHAGSRTCSLCDSRNGQLFDIDKVPLDHPNGFCFISPVYIIDGKEATMADIGKDLGKWVRGEPNSGAMDSLYGEVKPPKKTVKAIIKPKEEKLALDKLKAFNDYVKSEGAKVDRGQKEYLKLRREAMTELEEIMKKTKDRLSKKYKAVSKKTLDSIMDIFSKFSPDDIDAYNYYVGSINSFTMNKRLYTHAYKNSKSNKTDVMINKLTNLIDKSGGLKEDTNLVRFTGLETINDILTQANVDLKFRRGETSSSMMKEQLYRLNAELIGKKYKSESFLSTSYRADRNVFTNRPLKMEIYAKEGTKALYTNNERESEILLQRGTEFIIRGVEYETQKNDFGDTVEYTKIILEVV